LNCHIGATTFSWGNQKGAKLNNKVLLKLSVAAIAVVFAAQSVQAEAVTTKKKGFFETLFGTSPRKKRPPKAFWFNRNSDDNVRIIYGSGDGDQFGSNNQNYADLDEPESIPGLGMGNANYMAPKLLLLADPSFAKLTAGDTQSQAILAELSSLKTKIRTTQAEREPILDFYKKSGFKPLWLKAGAPSERARALLAFAAKTEEDGLDSASFLPVGMSGFANLPQASSTPQELAQFDIATTVVALKMALEISGGQFDPNRLSLYNDITPERVNVGTALNVLAYSPYPDAYLADLAPKNPVYAAMKGELAKLRGNGSPVLTPISEGKNVKLGRADPRIIPVRERMVALNFLEKSDATDDDLLDSDLSLALKKFQASVQIKQSGQLDAATVKYLNRDENAKNIQRLVANMERVRWLPKNLGSKYVIVNQAAFEVRVMDHGKQVWRSNVIVGKPYTQTSAFHDEMETVVFNPSWGVPQSIIVNEYLRKLRSDPGYLDRQGFKVVNQQGKVVSSRSVNWGAYGNKIPFGVQQPPGRGNALGELKFLFPNKHDIYMHDTPTKNLFAETTRAFSHGCVRVENPREFATVLLGWDRSRVDAETDGRKSQSVTLPQKIPVHITYFTAWPDSTGKMMYFNDIYGRDEAMQRAMESNVALRNSLASQKIVQN
jgi:murein L,D-transpeptidase YcbB/YkuD